MENLESFSQLDADLGSQFLSSKEVTIQFNGEDLQNLLAFKEAQQTFNDNNKQYFTEEQLDTVQELLDIVLEGVCNYNLA